MAGDIQKEDREMFKTLLIVDSIRGPHSTGVASATDKKVTGVFKRAMTPFDFIQHRAYDDVVAYDSQVLLGHNRWATVGKINNHTAHPFEHGSVIGAHNGTLKNWYSLPKAKRFNVDSECLLFNIAEYGWEATVKQLEGAWALTVYDAEHHLLQILRNEERPLWLGEKADGKVLYWASEAWMLRAMAGRQGIKLKKNIWQPKPHTLCTWELPKLKYNGVIKGPDMQYMEGRPEKKYLPPAGGWNQKPSVRTTKKQAGGSVSSIEDQRRRKSSNYTTDLVALLGVSVGESITFMPCSKEQSPITGEFYLQALLCDDPYSDIRLYATEEMVDNWIDKGTLLEARAISLIPSTKYRGEEVDAYAVVDSGSVKYFLGEDGNKAEDADVVLEFVKGPGNTMIEEKKFNELTKHGCSYCSDNLLFGETVHWLDQNPFCDTCGSEDAGKGE